MKKIKTMLILAIAVSISLVYTVNAQVSINTDGSDPDGSAMLDVKSTDKGMLLPRMAQADLELISNPANGLLVFNTDDGKLYVYISAFNRWNEVQYGSGEIVLPASYTIGSGGSCANTTVNGNFWEGITLNTTNTITLDATVTQAGAWSITTTTLNGYSFSGSGTFTTTGTVEITLNGTGAPGAAQTDIFTATADNSGGSCTFDVIIVACGDPFIYESQSYATVLIGTQCWMAENLNVGTRIDGDQNQTANGQFEKYCYGDTESNCNIYGGLYQWNETMQYVTTAGTQGICPVGWHVPTDDEWCTLENFVDAGTIDCNAISMRGTDVGNNLKEVGQTHWAPPSAGTDLFGFTCLPGGFCGADNSFNYLSYNANFWTSNESGSSAWWRHITSDNPGAYRYYEDKARGHSVRCLQD